MRTLEHSGWALSLTLAGLLLTLGASAPIIASDDETAIRSAFAEYKRALVEGDAVAAVAQVDQATLDYFEELRALAAGASEDDVRKRSFVDRLLILSIRHSFEAGQIQTLSLEELIGRATEEGWIAPQTVAQLEMGRIDVQDNQATAEAMTRASAANPNVSGPIDGLEYEFERNADGQWRFKFGSLVRSLNALVEQLTGQMGGNQDDFLFMLIESFSGEKVLPDVWERSSAPSSEEPSAENPPRNG